MLRGRVWRLRPRFLGAAALIPMPAQPNRPQKAAPRKKAQERMKAAEEAAKAAAGAQAPAEPAPAAAAPAQG